MHFLLLSERDAGFQKEHPATVASHELDRLGRPAKVMQQSIAIDDVVFGVDDVIVRSVHVELLHEDFGEVIPDDVQVFWSDFGGRYGAATIDEETGVISDARADLEHAQSGERQIQRGEVLLSTPVVP
jgi:hypothetical protein